MKYLAAFTLLASTAVNAAVLVTRDVSAPVQACVNGIASAAPLYTALVGNVSAWTPSNSGPTITNVHAISVDINEALTQAQGICCGIPSYTEEESGAVTSVFSTLATQTETLSELYVAGKSEFDKISFVTLIWRASMIFLEKGTSPLVPCLVSSTPAPQLPPLQSAVDTLSAAYADFDAVYNP